MPASYRQSEAHDLIKRVERQYRAVAAGLRSLLDGAAAAGLSAEAVASLRATEDELADTYVLRAFATFEDVLRTYDRAKHNDPARSSAASVLIDSIGGKRGHDNPASYRAGAHEVRLIRNRVAHQSADDAPDLTVRDCCRRLHRFVSCLDHEWTVPDG